MIIVIVSWDNSSDACCPADDGPVLECKQHVFELRSTHGQSITLIHR